MKKIYIITDNFPYGEGEKSFLLPELAYLKKKYKLSIISCARMADKKNVDMETKLDSDIYVQHYGWEDVKGIEVIKYIPAFLVSRITWNEVWRIIKSRNYFLRRVKSCMFFYANAVKFYKWMKEKGLFEKETIYYSYWYNSHLLSLLMKRRFKLKVITRAHGYDLYTERTDCGWQPYKHFMDKRVDMVCFISEYGYKYYLKRYAADIFNTYKYHLCRLGTEQRDACLADTRKNGFLLVSCSSLIPLKRVELIIEGLAEIEKADIRWVHFGAGDKMDELVQQAHDRLDDKCNIAYEFMGYMANEDIMNYYKNEKPSCFITTSSSEGSPVSIQEAIAFAIPVIGTEVGGIPEMIDGNGVLLSENPFAEEIKAAILYMYNASVEEYTQMRKRSLEIWRSDYDRNRNIEDFIRVISML